MTNDYSNLAVCTEHFTLTGVYEGKEHRCGCQHNDEEWDNEWDGYDIAALIDLCHLCVRDVMGSGSRWTWYACESCRKVNNEIATAILGESHPGNQILPLGRHSMMNGGAIGLDPPQSDDPTERIVESIMGFFEFSRRLVDWKGEEGQRLVDASGFDSVEALPLDRWLDAKPGSPGASADAMSRFIGEEDLPDLRELDGLRRAREDHLKLMAS